MYHKRLIILEIKRDVKFYLVFMNLNVTKEIFNTFLRFMLLV